MHTFNCENGTVIHFNPDLSGNVVIPINKNDIDEYDDNYCFIELNGEDIREFVLDRIKAEQEEHKEWCKNQLDVEELKLK